MGLSIGRRLDLSTRDPERKRFGQLAREVNDRDRSSSLTFDFLDTAADPLKSNAGVTSEDEIGLATDTQQEQSASRGLVDDERESEREEGTDLSQRSQADFEKRVDALGNDFSFCDGKHTEDDDGSSPLRSRDLLVGVCEKGRRKWKRKGQLTDGDADASARSRVKEDLL